MGAGRHCECAMLHMHMAHACRLHSNVLGGTGARSLEALNRVAKWRDLALVENGKCGTRFLWTSALFWAV